MDYSFFFRRFAVFARSLLRLLIEPPRAVEIALWALLITVIAGVRVYLSHLVPTYLWSKDSISYAGSAISWVDSGIWETNPKRGPIYSLIIAFCLKVWGTFDSLIVLQHIIGGLAILGAIAILRVMHGRRTLWPVAACGYAYAVHASPINLEHLVRNDAWLLIFSTTAFGALFLAIHRDDPRWLFPSGLATAVLTLTKNVFAPFPLVVIAGYAWHWRRSPKMAVRSAAIFIAGLVLVFAGAAIFRQLTVHTRVAEPQPGLMFFARVAQFTVLDGGIEPEIKALIREDIEAYRAMGKLDNNLILNRTAVPRMRWHYAKLGKTPGEFSQLCWRLAVEAVKAHPGEYARQIWDDFTRLNIRSGERGNGPEATDIDAACRAFANDGEWPHMNSQKAIERLEPATHPKYLRKYREIVENAWLFRWHPGLLTTLGVALLAFGMRGKIRLWWIAAAAVWWFTLVLLSTIGRPLDRYLLPALPICFWTLGTLITLLWNWIANLAAPWLHGSDRSPSATIEPATANHAA